MFVAVITDCARDSNVGQFDTGALDGPHPVDACTHRDPHPAGLHENMSTDSIWRVFYSGNLMPNRIC